MSDDD
jgi:Ca2+-binding EF-hand superfamily protein